MLECQGLPGWGGGKAGKPLFFVENLQVFVEKSFVPMGREQGGLFLDHGGMCKAVDMGGIPGRERWEAAG